MHDAETLFSQWLAAQDPFVQVGLGIVFILILVPLLLAGVAFVITRTETWLEHVITGLRMSERLADYRQGKWLEIFSTPRAKPVGAREPPDVVVAWRHAPPPNRK